jgi:hypothetical protein
MSKVLIMDTSMLCCWLQVPGKETCGTTKDKWNFHRVNAKIQEELAAHTTLVLPLAAIIETGNHIAQANGDRYSLAKKLGGVAGAAWGAAGYLSTCWW